MSLDETIIETPAIIERSIEERLGAIEHRLGEIGARLDGHEGKYHPDEPIEEEPIEEVPEIRDEQPESTHPWARRIGR